MAMCNFHSASLSISHSQVIHLKLRWEQYNLTFYGGVGKIQKVEVTQGKPNNIPFLHRLNTLIWTGDTKTKLPNQAKYPLHL